MRPATGKSPADGSGHDAKDLASGNPLALALSLIVLSAAGGLMLGGAIHWAGRPELARWIWGIALLPALTFLCVEIVAKLRQGNPGLDIVAALAMTLALALGETLAGAVVALMYSGGQMLESFAQRRARREMSALLSRVPKTAARHSDHSIEQVAIEAISPGDRLLIRTGESVPADGTLAADALLDQSMLTGESMPVRGHAGDAVPSGSINLGAAFDLVVTRAAADSTYAAIVRLVENAQSIKAPMVRLADRYGIWFLAATALVAGAAWLLSSDPGRALAVLVVATPCPLILAVPVAIMSGISHCAKHGVLVKDGAALETLARVQTVVIDKTGTLTEGRARLVGIEAQGDFSDDEVLRWAATLDLASSHVVATALVAAAAERGLTLGRPTGVRETSGVGIEGLVEGRRVAVGGGYVAQRLKNSSAPVVEPSRPVGQFAVMVAVDGHLAGQLILADELRTDIAESIERFHAAGVSRIVLASGDRKDITESIGARLDIDEIHGSLVPQDKVAVVMRERGRGCCVMMVGDGVNDAPALAAADLGVALGVRGAAASSEVANVVLVVDRIGSLADAVEIARRARRMALQSANAGVMLSLIAMAVAAAGHLPPVQGAILQEVIDVAVVLNALRALGGGPRHLDAKTWRDWLRIRS